MAGTTLVASEEGSMFGLMKVRTCRLSIEARNERRLHYCGTCKVLGTQYGTTARLILNHDAVFLAEVMSALAAPADAPVVWHHRLRSFNCLVCPPADEPMPLPLLYAAAAAVTLAEWKINDRCNDSSRLRWRLLRRMYVGSFQAAARYLKRWQFPLDELRTVLSTQEQRELEACSSTLSSGRLLDHVAAPTSVATALFCSYGAHLVGRGECRDDMYALGHSLGTIVYLLDAVEDYDRDLKRGDFNAIRSAFTASRYQYGNMPTEVREQVLGRINSLQREFEQALWRLPLVEADKERFADRLDWNLRRTLGMMASSERAQSHVPSEPDGFACIPRMTFSQRWRQAQEFGNSLAERFCPDRSTTFVSLLVHQIVRPIMVASMVPVAFIAPQQAAAAASYRECMGLGFNLMFLGMAGAVLAQMVSRLIPVAALQSMTSHVVARGKKHSPGEGGGGSGDCGCCDCLSGCDCDCCSGCDCDCCSCDC